METIQDQVSLPAGRDDRQLKTALGSRRNYKRLLHRIVVLTLFVAVWQLAANYYNSGLLLPTPAKTMMKLLAVTQDPSVLKNLLITLERVMTGFAFAVGIGVPLGFLMGYSESVRQAIDPLIGSVRQVPMMAWVPLSIVWFGLGEGPTVFLIAIVGVFPLILNTIAGVRSISPDYYHAARSMGAGNGSLFFHVILPGALPDILTGARIALGNGWMSVICAEFIATSAGFGYAMVEAQTRMETDKLLALMVMGALVGYMLDRGLQGLNGTLAGWRYGQQ